MNLEGYDECPHECPHCLKGETVSDLVVEIRRTLLATDLDCGIVGHRQTHSLGDTSEESYYGCKRCNFREPMRHSAFLAHVAVNHLWGSIADDIRQNTALFNRMRGGGEL